MITVHETLCQSSPYCWNREPLYKLLPNLGIALRDEGFFSADSTLEERKRVETVLKNSLDGKDPCGLVNLEFQLISGYDETGFIASQPWAPAHQFPPGHLTFSTWEELGEVIHMNFFTFKKVKPPTDRAMIIASLKYARDVYDKPQAHTSAPYSTGSGAYDTWIKAVEAGHGSSHGNWWNATVWGECRAFASSYFGEIATKFKSVSPVAKSLSADYQSISEKLNRIADKSLEAGPKAALLKEAKDLEIRCIDRIGSIVEKLSSM